MRALISQQENHAIWHKEKDEEENMYNEPMIRKGFCSKCGGPTDELGGHGDWWHNKATDCDGRKTGKFVLERNDE